MQIVPRHLTHNKPPKMGWTNSVSKGRQVLDPATDRRLCLTLAAAPTSWAIKARLEVDLAPEQIYQDL